MGRNLHHLAVCLPSLALLTASPAPPLGAHVEIERQVSDVSKKIAENPGDASLYLKRGELYRQHHDFDLALADFEAAATLAPDLAAVDLARGLTLLDAGRPQLSLPCLDRFLARLPAHVEGRVTRARALLALGRRLEAALDFTDAIHISTEERPPRPEHYLERAQALRAEGPEHLEEALDGLEEGIARLRSPAVLEGLAAELELARGNLPGALEHLEKAWAGSPRRETFLERKADILERADRLDEACLAYEAAQAALESLSPGKRGSRAMIELQARIGSGLERSREARTAHDPPVEPAASPERPETASTAPTPMPFEPDHRKETRP